MIANRSMPECAVIPVLGYPDVEVAVQWLEDTFGFRRRLMIGNHRAQMYVSADGGAIVVTQDASAKPAAVMVRVEDIDSHHQRAKAKRARVLSDPATFPYGERQYSVIDSGGHCWTFSQSVADVDPTEWGGSLA